MVNKNLFLFGCILSLFQLHAQSFKVDYEFVAGGEQNITQPTLIANAKESSFTVQRNFDTKKTDKKSEKNRISLGAICYDLIYNDFKSPDLYIESNMKKNGKVYFKQRKSNGVWEIVEGEKKEILGYSCQKATRKNSDGSFTIIAWFTSGINIPEAGPMKAHGLPGLVLEYAYRKTNEEAFKVHLVANKIEVIGDHLVVKPEKSAVEMDEGRYLVEQLYFVDRGTYNLIKLIGQAEIDNQGGVEPEG